MTTERVLEALRAVDDPEIGINVVDLGLVYQVDVANDDVHVKMTMTSPACPLHSYIREQAQEAIRRQIAEAASVEVEIVWDPPWEPARMSAAARRQLGWPG